MKKFLDISLLSCLLFAGLFARGEATLQSEGGVITGLVYDAKTRSPLAFSSVYLEGLLQGAETGSDGKFILSNIPVGSYLLQVERLGYAPYSEPISILPGKLINRNIALTPTEISGEEVLVTATRKEQTAQMAPASVVILRAEELQVRPITTFDQALEAVPGLAVYRTTGVNVQSLAIRGSSDVAGGGIGNRVLLMIDGRPALTSDAGGAYWSLVPTAMIERVEVVKGAFSSLYGSAAMGGVVNVITKRPSYRAQTTVNIRQGFYDRAAPEIRYTSKRPLQSEIEISHSGVNGPLSYLLNVSRKSADGHSENTEYKFYDAFAKLIYDMQQNRNLEIALGGGYSKNDYPHSWLNSAQPLRVRDAYRDDRQEKRQFNADIHYWVVPSDRLKYSSRFYYYLNAARSYFNENDPNYNIPFNDPYKLKTVVDGDKLGNITQFDFYLNEKNYLIGGVDVQVDHVDSSPDTVMYGNRQINNFAVYLQNETAFHPRFTATLGIRYDHNHLVSGKTLSQVSPKLSLVYRPAEPLSVRALFGQAFRAPTIAERFFQEELGGGTQFLPNPSLDAEKMDLSLELGLRYQVNRNVDLDLALFRYHYRDMIYWVDIKNELGVTYPYFQVRNLNRALMQGLELTLGTRWKHHWRGSINYTYLHARDESPGRLDDILAYRPDHTFFFNSDVSISRYTLNINGRYRSKIKEVFLYPLQSPGAFYVMNSKVSSRLTPHIRLSASVNNLLNTDYEELARYRMPGRNWVFGAEFNF